MHFTEDNNTYFLKLDKGEEVLSTIRKFVAQEQITSGYFSGLGALNQVTLRFLKQDEKEFIEKTFKEDFEVTSLSGNITQNNGIPYLHSHIVLANREFQAISGHFHEGVVGATLELVLTVTDSKISREYSDEIGLQLMKFKD